MYDADDDCAYTKAALAAHLPAAGRITVHPTPVASAPASLAHDLLRSMGKHLPPECEESTWWARQTDIAWRVVAAWITALRISHIVVTRAHRISSRHIEHLFALRELTGVHLTLLCHGPVPPVLAAALDSVPHRFADTLDGVRSAVGAPLQPLPADRYPWWEAAAQYPPKANEPCFFLPARSQLGPGELDAAARRLGRTVLALPAGGQFPAEPDHATALLAHRLHVRIAHPLHAAVLAQRVLTGHPGLKGRQSASRAVGGRDLVEPVWAADLFDGADRLAQLEGRETSRRYTNLMRSDEEAVEESARACGLLEPPPPVKKRAPKRRAASTATNPKG